MEDRFQVGIISSTHGIGGEVKVYPTTDDAKRFRKLKQVILDTGKEEMTLQVERVRFFKQMVILKFKEFQNINEVSHPLFPPIQLSSEGLSRKAISRAISSSLI